MVRGGIKRNVRKTYKRNCICSDLARFAYAGTYAELTPSLRENRRREEEQKRRGRRRRRRRRGRERKRKIRSRRKRSEEENAQFHRSTITSTKFHQPASFHPHTHSVPPASIDLAYADPYAELTRSYASRLIGEWGGGIKKRRGGMKQGEAVE